MKYDPPDCCPPHPHPPVADIPAGLTRLPRQIATFAQWRRVLLSTIKSKEALSDWQADSEGDLGVMLLEYWAYILDICAFYDARFAERSFLRTAHDEMTAHEITALIGYVPRPALVSTVELALRARGADPVKILPATGFRSEAFDGEPPQMFETLVENTIWPQRNRWEIAPYRKDEFEHILRFGPAEGPSRGSVLGVWQNDSAGVAETPLVAGRARSVRTEAHVDGYRYQRVRFSRGTDLTDLNGKALSDLTVFNFGLRIGLSLMVAQKEDRKGPDGGNTFLILDGLYPQIAENSPAVLQIGGSLHAVKVIENTVYRHPLPYDPVPDPPLPIPAIPLSRLVVEYSGDVLSSAVRLHVNPRELGAPTRPAEDMLSFADFSDPASPIAIKKPVRPFLEAPQQGSVIAVGEQDRGAKLSGKLEEDDDELWTFTPDADSSAFDGTLAAPIKLWGNIVSAVRGETVNDETLGSGNSSKPFQFFTLKKKPLSWSEDPAARLGRSPQIEVLVDGLFWTWVETLFDQAGNDRVYTIAMEPDGTAHVKFGDGKNGALLPTGVGNVRAQYRFGAGAVKPPAGAVNQIARTSKKLTQVVSPLAPYGGADAELAGEIRSNAPNFTLALDRAVSLADYKAMTCGYSGILNASASQRWSSEKLQNFIEIALIADSGDPSGKLKTFLEERSVPGMIINVALATRKIVDSFIIDLEIDPNYEAGPVKEAARIALFDDKTGLLCFRNIPIGMPVYRSHIIAALHKVPGITAVKSLMVDGLPMVTAMIDNASTYFDFITNGEIA